MSNRYIVQMPGQPPFPGMSITSEGSITIVDNSPSVPTCALEWARRGNTANGEIKISTTALL